MDMGWRVVVVGLGTSLLLAGLLAACGSQQASHPGSTPPASGEREGAMDHVPEPPRETVNVLRLPESLPRPSPDPVEVPESLAILLEREGLVPVSARAFRQRMQRYVGKPVRWWLRSWGGEVRASGPGFTTPLGVQPREVDGTTIGRIRLVDPSLPAGADLGVVQERGHPVVNCLASSDDAGGSHFIQREPQAQVAPVPRGGMWVNGMIWGATGNDSKDIWLLDCAADPPSDAPHGWQARAAELEQPEWFNPGSVQEPVQCPPPRSRDLSLWYSECNLYGSARYDTRRDRWLVLQIDHSEGGPESFELASHTPTSKHAILRHEVAPRHVHALRRALRRRARFPEAANLVQALSPDYFSLNQFAPLVSLGGPLEGWLLYLHTSQDLERPEHVAWLIARDGSEIHELARKVAPTIPCDADGRWCFNTGEECDEDGLLAEGRLCVLQLGIDFVALSPDGTSLLVTGTEQVAGHGGAPGFVWNLAMPAGGVVARAGR